MNAPTTTNRMSLLVALFPVIALIVMLAADVVWFGEDSSYGSNQMALLIAALIAGGIGVARGTKWKEIRDAIASSIGQATEAILILLLIGALTG
ncbi:MAG: sodium:proton antiporter, partial [Flavobacteriales bacterium]